jgi:hypothetical protein
MLKNRVKLILLLLVRMEQSCAVEQCVELKNIKYKTMLMNHKAIKETKSMDDLSNLEKFLENEKNNNQNEPWCKLNKTIKMKKLIEYAQIYRTQNNLDQDEEDNMVTFFKNSLERKKLHKVKDVVYDKTSGVVTEIPLLSYARASKHFTLKNNDNRISTIKSLSVKKTNSTVRNKSKITTVDVEEPVTLLQY